MATFSSVFVPATNGRAAATSVNTVTSSAEIVLGFNVKFLFASAASMTIAFGTSGMAAADANCFLIPANVQMIFDIGRQFDRIRVFNTSGSTATFSILPLGN